jgi:hypothetical protein
VSPELNRPAEFDSNLNAPTSFTLSGRRLFLARLGWLVMFILTIGLFAASIPVYYDSLISFSDPEFDAAAARASLEAAGVSMDFYARYLVPISVAYTMVYFVVGTVIFWRRSDNWIALLASMCLITFGTFGLNEGVIALPDQVPAVWLPVHLLALLATVSIYTFVLIFPNGRFVPRWTRWAVIFFAVHDVFYDLFPDSIFNIARSFYLLDAVVLSIVICIPIVAQLYRYRYVSTPVERQQTKWVVFGVVSASLGALAFEVPISGSPLGQFGPLHALAIQAGFFGSQLLLPLSIGIAIIHDRLWDIDVIINRTLVYGLLTAILAGVYVGGVTATQVLFRILGGQEELPQLVVVASTLVIAALFNPLRRRIQSFIDRRFYRTKYDARKTLEDFSAQLRDETDLEALSDDLVGVVRVTMQPAHVSLWLKPETAQKGKQAD